MIFRSLGAVAVAALVLRPTVDAEAQLPVSLRLSGLYARQAATITATSAGVDLGETSTFSNAIGAELRVGLPVVGFDLGAHYLRHFGDVDPEFDANLDDVGALGLGANEFGAFAERRFSLVPLSPVKPTLGLGVSYARVQVSSTIDFTSGFTGPDDLESSANVFRVYGVGSIDVVGGLGVVARAGIAFSGVETVEVSSPLEVNDVAVEAELDYDGFFVSVGISLLGI